MDSCASSIITAYLYSIELGLTESRTKSADGSPSLVLPLLNIPREDLNLRPDIKYLLQKAGIAPTSLPFMDDLTKLSLSKLGGASAFLVDHNKLVGAAKDIFGNRVVGVIDHHDDEGAYESEIKAANGPRIIKKTGSCSSLVATHFYSTLGAEVFNNDKDLNMLALGPLLQDTSAMKSPKVEDPDREAFKLYLEFLGISKADVKELYNTLDAYKKDVSTLTGSEFLRKDYKEWAAEGQFKGGKIGISSMVKSLNWLFNSYDDFENDMKAWGKQRQLDVMVLNCSYKNAETGKFHRDLLIWSPSGLESDRLLEVIEEIKAPLDLSPLQLENKVLAQDLKIHMFNQGNTKASRKQVAPLLKFHIQGVPLNTL